jgi:hypothetical protein
MNNMKTVDLDQIYNFVLVEIIYGPKNMFEVLIF